MDKSVMDVVRHVPESMAKNTEGLEYAIVRCSAAGVHAGYVESVNGDQVVLRGSRRLWRWHGRTLSGLAIEGTTDAGLCKYGPSLDKITLRDWCEIIPCTESGMKSIVDMKEWENG